MKKPFVIIYTIIISITLCLAIGLFGYNIYTDYNKGIKAAENRFERMSLSIKQIPESVKFNSKTFETSVFNAINGIENYSYLRIEINNQSYLTYPTSDSKQPDSSNMVVEKSKTFELHGNVVKISAGLFVLTPAVINHDVKISFAIILFVTVLTLFMILLDAFIGGERIQNKKSNKKEEKKEPVIEEPVIKEPVLEEKIETEIEEPVLEEKIEPVSETEPVIQNEEEPALSVIEPETAPLYSEDPEPQFSEVVFEEPFISTENNKSEEQIEVTEPSIETPSETETKSDASETKTEETETPSITKFIIPQFEEDGKELTVTTEVYTEKKDDAEVEIEDSEIKEYKSQLENNEIILDSNTEVNPIKTFDEQEGPAGLFSPVTGFGWESYLNTRLENELNRATASEIDLSLFIIQIYDINRESDLTKEICDYLTSQFQFKDMIFEYKNDSYVCLKIGSTIDEAISFANKLLLDIDNILKGIGKCYIGISSRSIRMVSAERLVKEAEQALIHAREEKDSPIIAFRVDADKYRKYLEQNNN